MMTHMPSDDGVRIAPAPVLLRELQHLSFVGFASFSRIHLMPCSCGSMISGQRLQQVMMAPFSILMRSAGRPSPIILRGVRLEFVST